MKKHLIFSVLCVMALSSVTTVLAMPDKAVNPVNQNNPPAGAPFISGKALQTMDSGGYTYVYVEKNDGEKVWVASTPTQVAVGSQVSYRSGMEMANFESKGLNRKFDKIIFADAAPATDASTNTIPAPPSKRNDKSASGGSKAAASAKDAKISVTRAKGANAYTVKEIFEKSAKLNKKKVVISGKVVKVSAGIMDKNWIHIQDGTGSQAKKNHNLVCTSKDLPDVGDVVTVSGVLAKDRDFGGGYKYNAIVENASIIK